MAPVVTDPHNLRGLRRDVEPTETPDVEISVDALLRMQDAGVLLNETGKTRIKVAEQNAEVEADRRVAQAREARVRLDEAEAAYLVAREEVLRTVQPYVFARECAAYLRVEYGEAWAAAHKLGVASARLEPSVFPDEIRYRLQSLSINW